MTSTTNLRTADGYPITDGMRVWDNDLQRGTVELSQLDADGWFYVRTDTGDRSSVNGERVCTRHPFTGERAGVVAAPVETHTLTCDYCVSPATRELIDGSDVLCVPCARSQTDGPLREYVKRLTGGMLRRRGELDGCTYVVPVVYELDATTGLTIDPATGIEAAPIG